MKILDYSFHDCAVGALVAVANLDELGYQTCCCDPDEDRRERRQNYAHDLINLLAPPESEHRRPNKDEEN